MAKILIIEDDADTAESLAILLKLVGHDAEIALDGYRAIEIARRQHPQYVLLDIALPGLDGYHVVSTLRQDMAEPMTVIAITGYGQEEHRRLVLEGGFDHYFLKPVDHSELFALLSRPIPEPSFSQPAGESPQSRKSSIRSTRLVSRSVEITNALGLHLRAADKFVRTAQQFQAEIRVGCDGRTANGRSILDLTTLAAECGCRLELAADGPDAMAAVAALSGLIEGGFDEPLSAPGQVAMTDSPSAPINDRRLDQ